MRCGGPPQPVAMPPAAGQPSANIAEAMAAAAAIAENISKKPRFG